MTDNQNKSSAWEVFCRRRWIRDFRVPAADGGQNNTPAPQGRGGVQRKLTVPKTPEFPEQRDITRAPSLGCNGIVRLNARGGSLSVLPTVSAVGAALGGSSAGSYGPAGYWFRPPGLDVVCSPRCSSSPERRQSENVHGSSFRSGNASDVQMTTLRRVLLSPGAPPG